MLKKINTFPEKTLTSISPDMDSRECNLASARLPLEYKFPPHMDDVPKIETPGQPVSNGIVPKVEDQIVLSDF